MKLDLCSKIELYENYLAVNNVPSIAGLGLFFWRKKNYITYALSRSQCRDFHVASVLLPDFDKIPKRSKLTSEKNSSLI